LAAPVHVGELQKLEKKNNIEDSDSWKKKGEKIIEQKTEKRKEKKKRKRATQSEKKITGVEKVCS